MLEASSFTGNKLFSFRDLSEVVSFPQLLNWLIEQAYWSDLSCHRFLLHLLILEGFFFCTKLKQGFCKLEKVPFAKSMY